MARDFTRSTTAYFDLGTGTLAPLFDGFSNIGFTAYIHPDSYATSDGGDNRLIYVSVGSANAGLIANVNDTGSNAYLRVGGRSQNSDGFQVLESTSASLTAGSGYWVGGNLNFTSDIITVYSHDRASLSSASQGSKAFGSTTFVDPGSGYSSADGIPNALGSDADTWFDGAISHVAFWAYSSPIVGPAMMNALASGRSPLTIRSEALVAYFPLVGDSGNSSSLVGNITGTAQGGLSGTHRSEHPILNNGQVFYSLPVAAGGSITGTIAVTEDDDTSAATGTQYSNITGTIAVTETDDVSAATGTQYSNITGTIGVTETDDVSAASGTVTGSGVSGTIAITEDDDVSAASGTQYSNITGTIGVTEADDVSAASGVVNTTHTGTIIITETDDVSAASGTVPVATTTPVMRIAFGRRGKIIDAIGRE